MAAIDKLSPLAPVLSVDGGMTRNRYFTRFLADAMNKRVRVPSSAELTGLGAAQLAMIGAGFAEPRHPAAVPAAESRDRARRAACRRSARALRRAAIERSKAWR